MNVRTIQIIIISVLILFSSVGIAQSAYFKVMSDSIDYYGRKLAVTNRNEVVFVGRKLVNQEYRLILSMVEETGNELWSKKYDVPNLIGTAIDVCDNGDLFLSGGYGQDKLYCMRTDSTGSVIWSNSIEVDQADMLYAKFAIQTSDLGFIICGNLYAQDDASIYIIKLDSTGNKMWSTLYRGALPTTSCTSIHEIDGNSYVVSGYSNSFSNSNDIILFEIDSIGDVNWSNKYGGTGDETMGEMIIDNNIISLVGNVDFANDTLASIFLLNLDAQGAPTWGKSLNSPGEAVSWGNSLKQNGNGEYLLISTVIINNSIDILLTKIDSVGNHIWSKTFGGIGWERAMDITLDLNDEIVFTGYSSSYSTYSSSILVKLDSNELIGCEAYPFSDSLADYLPVASPITLTYYGVFDQITPLAINSTNISGAFTEICSGCNPPIADFNYTISGNVVTFSDNSTAHTWEWDFGDLYTSIEENPVHTFTSLGEYTVCVRSTNFCGVDSVCQEIDIVSMGTISHRLLEFSVYPNPAKSSINVKIASGLIADVKVLSINGRLLLHKGNVNTLTVNLQVEELPKGLYLIEVSNKKGYKSISKLVLQ